MNEIRVLKRVVILLAAWTGVVLGVSTAVDDGASAPAQEPSAAVSGSSEPGTARPVPSAPKAATSASSAQRSSSVDDHDTLERDALMTQRMSAPNAAGPMFTGQVQDDQLAHSQNPGFIRALEEHQADIDRMLARP